MAIHSLELEEMLLRLGTATVLGALLGFNREHHGKPAGLKTLTLVSIGSASFMMIAIQLFVAVPATEAGPARIDLVRVIQGVIGGIGFLGAGSILRAQGDVVGMTTAATIWTVAAVGMACGLGQHLLAALITVVTWVVLVGFGFAERRWMRHAEERTTHRRPPAD